MSEPRKPLFGFLWPSPDPNAPVDSAARQVRLVRVAPRGPIRLAVLVVACLAVVSGAGSILMAALGGPPSPWTFVLAALVATAVFLVLRGWVVGTYVNDEGVRIECTWRRRAVPWSAISEVRTVDEPGAWLGLPLRARSPRVRIVTTSGDVLATHLYAASPDLWLRPEAFDMARLRLERWNQESAR